MGSIASMFLKISAVRHFFQDQARKVMIKRAERVLGPGSAEDLQVYGQSYWDTKKSEIQNKELVYPSYYTREYHGYPEGNLCWQAGKQRYHRKCLLVCEIYNFLLPLAYEAEIMSKVASIKAEPNSPANEAEKILRGKYMTAIKNIVC